MSSRGPAGRETTQVARLDFILVSATAIWISALFGGALLAFHDPLSANPKDLDDPAKLTDLLVVAIALSGITLPLIITYLSLATDIFFEIGDKVPLFLLQVGLSMADLAIVAQTHDCPQENKNDVIAISHLSELKDEPGMHLSPDDKAQLLHHMSYELRKKYYYYFNEKNDQILLRWHVLQLGISSLICLLLILFGHFNKPIFSFNFISHWAAIMAVGANFCSYYFLVNLARWRERLQSGITQRVREISYRMPGFVVAATESQEESGAAATDRVNDSAGRLKDLL